MIHNIIATWLSKKYFRLHLSQSEHQQAICETSNFFFWLIFLVLFIIIDYFEIPTFLIDEHKSR